ncbi:MAG: pilus assembly protein TadG-related protein [Clostridiaceae bacterium]
MFKKIRKEESGQALPFFALFFVVLLGFAALVVDVGWMYQQKATMQQAADAAALAGVRKLPDLKTEAEADAYSFAEKNGFKTGVQNTTVSALTPFESSNRKIQVTISRIEPNIFAKVLGIESSPISVEAVAEMPGWGAEVLPFINLDKITTIGTEFTAWEKNGPGDKERIHNDVLTVDPNTIHVNYKTPIDKKGVMHPDSILFSKGTVSSKIPDALEKIAIEGRIVYLIAIKPEEVENYQKKGIKELKEGDWIPCIDTVLLKVEVLKTFEHPTHLLELKLLDTYPWDVSKGDYAIPGVNGSPSLEPRMIK